ncbi:hypothetical protein J6590_002864 [Homalodisca vitripennis]|nr:hypothetical protein J6590_002864 [Homalodisca vitripennis]
MRLSRELSLFVSGCPNKPDTWVERRLKFGVTLKLYKPYLGTQNRFIRSHSTGQDAAKEVAMSEKAGIQASCTLCPFHLHSLLPLFAAQDSKFGFSKQCSFRCLNDGCPTRKLSRKHPEC